MTASPHPLVSVAREAIRVYVEERRELLPADLLHVGIDPAAGPAGVFVCLKRGTELRGCIGTTEPTKATLVEEVISNAIAAASRDPRFPIVQAFEIMELSVSVDVLGDPEPVVDPATLDPRRYGVIVRSGTKHGVLLPAIEGIESVEEQLAFVRQKAGLGPDEAAELLRFEVTRHI